jgi:hypothetical protein
MVSRTLLMLWMTLQGLMPPGLCLCKIVVCRGGVDAAGNAATRLSSSEEPRGAEKCCSCQHRTACPSSETEAGSLPDQTRHPPSPLPPSDEKPCPSQPGHLPGCPAAISHDWVKILDWDHLSWDWVPSLVALCLPSQTLGGPIPPCREAFSASTPPLNQTGCTHLI